MRHYKAVSLTLTVAAKLISATDGSSTWQQWTTTPTPECLPVTITSTYIDTQYKTATAYITVLGPTTTETEYKTVTSIPAPVTTVSYSTITQLSTVTQYSTINQVDTVTSVAISNQIVTIPETIPVTIVSSAFITTEATTTITKISSFTEYVSVTATCPIPQSGITTCTSRIINPTYTTSAFPSNYRWGCPPGQLCRPRKDGCNFEQNLPADTYYCSPDECQPVSDIPPLRDFIDLENLVTETNGSCALFTPIDDYFNINPLNFGLDFGIFKIFGQPTCTPTPAAVTVTVSCSQTAVPSWSAWNSPVTPVTSAAAGWGNWGGSYTGPAPSHVTKRAELSDMVQLDKRVVPVPSQCYFACDQAMAVWQSNGNAAPSGCDVFGQAFASVTACTKRWIAAADVTSAVSSLDVALLSCRIPNARRMTDEELKDLIQGKAPAFRFARN